MSVKDKIINGIIDLEAGYVDNPADSGGPTKFGITEAVARADGYKGDMRDLPRERAFIILSRKYWDANRLSDIEALSPAVADEVADTGVNMGVHVAAEFLQRSLNALNRRQAFYPDLKVDGVIGPRSLKALHSYLWYRDGDGEKVLLKMLNCLQGAAYVGIAERREKDEDFIFGWFRQRIS